MRTRAGTDCTTRDSQDRAADRKRRLRRMSTMAQHGYLHDHRLIEQIDRERRMPHNVMAATETHKGTDVFSLFGYD